jgi:hypothetical protein
MVAVLGLPLALWAAIPAVQWCAAGTDLANAACFVGSGATAEAAVVLQTSAPARAAARVAPRRVHAAASHASCAGGANCPYASCTNATPARPMARDALPAAVAHPRTAKPETAPRRARTFCLTDPNGGVGVRPHPPQLRTHTVLPAIAVSGDACAASFDEGERVAPDREARPPTHRAEQHPPVRGPPDE